MSTAAIRPDPFVQAHKDAVAAVSTFLPSLVGRQEPPPPPPSPMAAPQRGMQEGLRVASLARHVENMSARVVRGLPPEEPKPTPEQQFGNTLDAVHTRAIQEAIASHPETERGRLISEAHDSAVKWIASHNGKVIVHGKVQLAHSPETAERLAATIVNNEVEGHDQRKAEEVEQSDEGNSNANRRPTAAPSGISSETPGSTGAEPVRVRSGVAPDPGGRGEVAADLANQSSAIAPKVVPPGNVRSLQPAPVPVPVAQGNTPEVVPPGDGQQPAQGPPPIVKPQEAAKVGTAKPDGHQITQPKPTIPANQKLAAAAAPELHQALSTLTQQVPGIKFDRIRPQKSTDRLDQKVEDQNDPDTLSDYLGAQLAADSPQAKDAMIDALKKNFKVIEVDDQFLTGRKDKAQYPSANVQVQLSNGSTAEVQIVPAEVQAATEQSHGFYKKGREAEEAGDTKGRDQHWAKAAEINQGALAQFKARNGIQDSQPQTVGGYEMIGEPIKIGSHTFLRVKHGGGNGGNSSGAESIVHSEAQAGTVSQSGPDPNKSGGGDDIGADSAAASGSPVPSRGFTKGQSVTLKDGTPATVAYVDPGGKFIRAHTADGKLLRQLDPEEDLAHAAAE
jgi:hypothetical protein